MKAFLKIAAAASLVSLVACGGRGDDALGDNVADAAEAEAENLEAAAENTANQTEADALENRAEAIEEAGERREEAIDDADVNAQGMTNAQKEAIVNGQ